MHDLTVIGGGPAGTAAAITAARLGARVLLLEAGRFPRHKVCGEFVSPEALNLLASLVPGSNLLAGAPRVSRARLFLDGNVFEAPVAPAAASIPRIELDGALWSAAEKCGVECHQRIEVKALTRTNQYFSVATEVGGHRTRTVIDASGRWSRLNRTELGRNSHVGLKAHFSTTAELDSTDLYFFSGGYCGVQPIGRGQLNVCAMVRKAGSITMADVFARHPRLAAASRGWRQLMDAVATSPLVFRAPVPEDNGVLRAGDAAAFIDPFAGDGIALALRTGEAAAQALEKVWKGDVELTQAAEEYRDHYQRQFGPVFRSAARLRRILSLPAIARTPFMPLLRLPAITEMLVKKTRAA